MKIGRISSNEYKRSVFRSLQINKNASDILNGAGIGEDCAIFLPKKEEIIGTDMVQGFVTVPGDKNFSAYGEYLEEPGAIFIRGINKLFAKSVCPRTLQITLICPENMAEGDMKLIYQELGCEAAKRDIQVTGAFSRVSKGQLIPMLVLSFTGFAAKDNINLLTGPKAGQDIVITKWIAMEGTAFLARHYKERLRTRYPEHIIKAASDLINECTVEKEAAGALKSGVCAIHTFSEGGIFSGLWELCEEAGVGLSIDLKKIPIRQETVEVCEFFGINPYLLMSTGTTIMTTFDGIELTRKLKEAGIPGVIVGKLTDQNDRLITNEDEVRYLDRPAQDEIYKFLAKENGQS